jgi:predicted nucleic acid-binding protein
MTDRVTATEQMETLNLDFDDAVAYAAMKATETKEIVSMDKHFDRIPDIKRIQP